MGEQIRKIKLYALSTCPTCKRVKQFLDEQGLQYSLIEVDQLDSGEQWLTSKELKKYDPVVVYPTLVVEKVIKGFDENAIKDALEIK